MARTLRYNLVGQTIGKLTVLERSGSKSNAVCWKCKCECGNETTRTTPGLIRAKVPPSCGCVGNPKNRKYENSRQATTAAFYRRYKYDADNRNLIFSLTQDEFLDIILQECHYCGEPPSKKWNVYTKYGRSGTQWIDDADIKLNGVDRVNNDVGYLPDNCVPCCVICNYAKRNKSKQDFLQWINRVWNHQNK